MGNSREDGAPPPKRKVEEVQVNIDETSAAGFTIETEDEESPALYSGFTLLMIGGGASREGTVHVSGDAIVWIKEDPGYDVWAIDPR